MLRFPLVRSRLNPKQFVISGSVASVGLLLASAPALAHHPFGGATPTNAVEGVLSGLGHPVVGPDHLAFVIAVGLIAAVMGRVTIPVSFVVASMAGTGIHLMEMNLPAAEFFIAASVLLFGGLLAMKQPPQVWMVTLLAAAAGLFHGYAYGEAVVGAEVTPLFAYLFGFAAVQMGISLTAYSIAQRLSSSRESSIPLNLRFAGFTLMGVGAAFLSGVMLG